VQKHNFYSAARSPFVDYQKVTDALKFAIKLSAVQIFSNNARKLGLKKSKCHKYKTFCFIMKDGLFVDASISE